jgi:hypothetical protein
MLVSLFFLCVLCDEYTCIIDHVFFPCQVSLPPQGQTIYHCYDLACVLNYHGDAIEQGTTRNTNYRPLDTDTTPRREDHGRTTSHASILSLGFSVSLNNSIPLRRIHC